MGTHKNNNPTTTARDNSDFIYEQAIRQLRLEVARGRTYNQACRSISALENSIKEVVENDFLKIMIAEKHFGDGNGIDDIALFLDVPYETVENAKDEMLEEVGEELAARKFLKSSMTH